MYTSTVFMAKVRDAAARYGAGRLEREEFPAESALRDLRGGGGAGGYDALRIVARYCAIRFVLLREAGRPDALVEHARDAAIGHLDAAGAGWSEGRLLRRLVAATEVDAHAVAEDGVVSALTEAAAAAEAAGHVHGAYATLRAAYVVTRRRVPLGAAATVAGRLAELLRRHGEPRPAAAWARRRERHRRLEAKSPPPRS